ncbi:MAG: hypothetical protein NC336_01660 [Clostridium sp.]|nr:hypothetical protein [Clostridium sp.]
MKKSVIIYFAGMGGLLVTIIVIGFILAATMRVPRNARLSFNGNYQTEYPAPFSRLSVVCDATLRYEHLDEAADNNRYQWIVIQGDPEIDSPRIDIPADMKQYVTLTATEDNGLDIRINFNTDPNTYLSVTSFRPLLVSVPPGSLSHLKVDALTHPNTLLREYRCDSLTVEPVSSLTISDVNAIRLAVVGNDSDIRLVYCDIHSLDCLVTEEDCSFGLTVEETTIGDCRFIDMVQSEAKSVGVVTAIAGEMPSRITCDSRLRNELKFTTTIPAVILGDNGQNSEKETK